MGLMAVGRSFARLVQALSKAPDNLLANPRTGEQLFEFEPHEVGRILVGRYDIRYELQESTLQVLHLWHTGENR